MDLSSAFAEAEQRYGLPTGYLEATARLESSLDPSAKNPRSSAAGLFQFMPATAAQYGLEDPYDPIAAIDAAGRFTRDNMDYLRTQLGREPQIQDLYIAHQQGMGGAVKILQNPDADLAQLVGRQEAQLNAGGGLTAGQFYQQWTDKFNTALSQSGTQRISDPVTASEDALSMLMRGAAPQAAQTPTRTRRTNSAIGRGGLRGARSRQLDQTDPISQLLYGENAPSLEQLQAEFEQVAFAPRAKPSTDYGFDPAMAAAGIMQNRYESGLDAFDFPVAPGTLGETFGRGIAQGSLQADADVAFFGSLIATALGEEDNAANRLERARRIQERSAMLGAGMEQFDEFLEAPTFGGFINQVVGGTGQLLPAAASTIVTAIGTGGFSVLGRIGATATSRTLGKRMLSQAASKAVKGEALDQGERQALKGAYDYMRTFRRGATAGAFATEYPMMAGGSFAEFDEAGVELTRERALQAAGIGLPLAAAGVFGESLMVNGMLKIAKREAAKEAGEGVFTRFVKDVTGTAAKSGLTEGGTELLQEEALIRQRMLVDEDYTDEEANLRRAQAAFLGFFGGGAFGAVGSTPTAGIKAIGTAADRTASNVTRKASALLNTAKEAAINAKANFTQFGTGRLNQATPESESDIQAQIAAVRDPTSEKDAVWVPEDDPENPRVPKALLDENGDAIPNKIVPITKDLVAVYIPGKGTLITKADSQSIAQNVLDQGASDESLAAALNFSDSKPASAEGEKVVVRVRDKSGNVVSEQLVDKKDEFAALKRAEGIAGAAGSGRTIDVVSVEQALEQRARRKAAEETVARQQEQDLSARLQQAPQQETAEPAPAEPAPAAPVDQSTADEINTLEQLIDSYEGRELDALSEEDQDRYWDAVARLAELTAAEPSDTTEVDPEDAQSMAAVKEVFRAIVGQDAADGTREGKFRETRTLHTVMRQAVRYRAKFLANITNEVDAALAEFAAIDDGTQIQSPEVALNDPLKEDKADLFDRVEEGLADYEDNGIRVRSMDLDETQRRNLASLEDREAAMERLDEQGRAPRNLPPRSRARSRVGEEGVPASPSFSRRPIAEEDTVPTRPPSEEEVAETLEGFEDDPFAVSRQDEGDFEEDAGVSPVAEGFQILERDEEDTLEAQYTPYTPPPPDTKPGSQRARDERDRAEKLVELEAVVARLAPNLSKQYQRASRLLNRSAVTQLLKLWRDTDKTYTLRYNRDTNKVEVYSIDDPLRDLQVAAGMVFDQQVKKFIRGSSRKDASEIQPSGRIFWIRRPDAEGPVRFTGRFKKGKKGETGSLLPPLQDLIKLGIERNGAVGRFSFLGSDTQGLVGEGLSPIQKIKQGLITSLKELSLAEYGFGIGEDMDSIPIKIQIDPRTGAPTNVPEILDDVVVYEEGGRGYTLREILDAPDPKPEDKLNITAEDRIVFQRQRNDRKQVRARLVEEGVPKKDIPARIDEELGKEKTLEEIAEERVSLISPDDFGGVRRTLVEDLETGEIEYVDDPLVTSDTAQERLEKDGLNRAYQEAKKRGVFDSGPQYEITIVTQWKNKKTTRETIYGSDPKELLRKATSIARTRARSGVRVFAVKDSLQRVSREDTPVTRDALRTISDGFNKGEDYVAFAKPRKYTAPKTAAYGFPKPEAGESIVNNVLRVARARLKLSRDIVAITVAEFENDPDKYLSEAPLAKGLLDPIKDSKLDRETFKTLVRQTIETMKANPSRRAQVIYSDGRAIIIVNNWKASPNTVVLNEVTSGENTTTTTYGGDLVRSDLEMATALAHELGHLLFNEEIEAVARGDELTPSGFNVNALKKMYLAHVERLLKADGVDAEALKRVYTKDMAGFEEWYSDQVASALVGDATQTLTGAYFKRIVQRLRALFVALNNAMNKRLSPSNDFRRDYLEKVIEARRYQGGVVSPSVMQSIQVRNLLNEVNKKVPRSFRRRLRAEIQKLRQGREANLLRRLVFANADFLRGLDAGDKSGPGHQLSRMLLGRSQSTEGAGFHTLQQTAKNRFAAMFMDIFGFNERTSSRELQADEIRNILLEAEDDTKSYDDLSPQAKKLRDFFNELWDYIDEWNQESRRTGVGSPIDIGKRENFFHRVWDIEKIVGDPDSFKQFLMAQGLSERKADSVIDTFKQADTENLQIIDKAAAEKRADPDNKDVDTPVAEQRERFVMSTVLAAREGLDSVINASRSDLKGLLKELKKFYSGFETPITKLDPDTLSDPEIESAIRALWNEETQRARLQPGMQTNVRRSLDTITNKAARNALGDADPNGWLIDPAASVIDYIHQVTRAVEWERQGGYKKVKDLINALPEKDRADAERAIEGNLGKLGKGIHTNIRTLNSVSAVLTYIPLLLFTVLSSFTDLAGIALRGKEFRNLKNMGSVIFKTMNPNDREYQDLARSVGVVVSSSIDSVYASVGELDFYGPKARALLNGFFKYTGLNWWTRTTRVMAVAMGKEFILNTANRENFRDRDVRYLAELGLTREDVKKWQEGDQSFSSPEGVKMRNAIARFAEESIIRPNAAQRPTFGSDPHFQILMQLKSYYYAWGKTVVGGFGREIQNRIEEENGSYSAALMPLMLMSATVFPLTMLGLFSREWAKYLLQGLIPGMEQSEDVFKSRDMDLSEYSWEIFERSGLLGPFAMLFTTAESFKYEGIAAPFIANIPIVDLFDDTLFDGDWLRPFPVLNNIQ